MFAVRTAQLSKRYGDTLALDGLDLDVQEGEVYGYLGPNGAGKTTTIRLLLGLHRPSAGRAELFGVDCWRDPVAAHASAHLSIRTDRGLEQTVGELLAVLDRRLLELALGP